MEIIYGVISGKIEKHKLFEQNPILNTLFSDVKSHNHRKKQDNHQKQTILYRDMELNFRKRYKKMVG